MYVSLLNFIITTCYNWGSKYKVIFIKLLYIIVFYLDIVFSGWVLPKNIINPPLKWDDHLLSLRMNFSPHTSLQRCRLSSDDLLNFSLLNSTVSTLRPRDFDVLYGVTEFGSCTHADEPLQSVMLSYVISCQGVCNLRLLILVFNCSLTQP